MFDAPPVRSEPGSVAGRRVLGVGELVAGLRGLLEDSIGRVWVAGEISNLRQPASGHAYFTLKDDDAQLRCALFRGAARRLVFDPEDGMAVLAYGELTVYEPRGDLQLIVRNLEPRGEGALQVAFEQLRARLEREGLFDEARKRPIPEHPRRVGVVTSATGAALRDVLRVAAGRHGGTPLLLAPTRVQGAGAEAEIAAALAAVGERPGVDVALLVRGGGSLEDLQAFNHEAVARAIRASRVPVVCGVGHEVDVTIADLAADLRAPTPSAAAAAVVPDGRRLAERLAARSARLLRAAEARLDDAEATLRHVRATLRGLSPSARLAFQTARLGAALARLRREAAAVLERGEARLAARAARLDGLSPLAVLGRGYALVQRAGDGALVRAPGDVAPGDALRIRLAEGEIEAEVRRPGGGARPSGGGREG
ncbi:MAG TPA: exodeoxyribonuclease VII large subunit [Myxococcota bacterium]|nr:exodeoxyribonuclease VII large subunit [Myxococcota bacterium]